MPSPSRAMWEGNAEMARACLSHPFVRGIADGTLRLESFKFYVGQDAFFLDSFCRAYALATAKAPDAEAMRSTVRFLEGALEELKLHGSYARRWGIELKPKPAPVTRAYADFLLRVAWSEPFHRILAAMMPCMKLYFYLGCELKPEANPGSPYLDWVKTYSDPMFGELVEEMEGLYDRTAPSLDPTAEENYRNAMELELAFFEQAYRTAG